MSTQPKPIGVSSLRLADELDAVPETGADPQLIVDSAAELRILHAGLQRCKQVCDATAEGWRADAEKWKAERDSLMEVLKQIAGAAQRVDNLMSDKDIARAAIKAMEEKP